MSVCGEVMTQLNDWVDELRERAERGVSVLFEGVNNTRKLYNGDILTFAPWNGDSLLQSGAWYMKTTC